MTIFSRLVEQAVGIPLKATTKDETLHELVGLLKQAGLISNVDEAYQAVANREKQGSTGLGEEIAIPHAKTTAVADVAIAVGIAPNGIEFSSLDGKPVKIFFLILANPDYASAHIEALSDIAKLTRNKSFCKTLLASKTQAEVLHIFQADD